ncbi:hypothetical protein A3B45_02755 [Candidatus Daviesbacteria bacterium RIFCSPLOWO2_01_FULL_39_12]|uniref:Uncharacterized protein n=1 Tax=Candidatus Daviesbacteria bacterium RIFCSPLOWO2_01_FULL_39_12 TaxID=1797785 RepID=A0A1F5KSX1_9BACT|nr:MAG: hypothetical protein A3D79_02465 [Candidatus Daviesbacteria bacterium RIFCSPHIGHO2_02_FULL_39_8]OGE43925.1 MAG: hypothetical protein A3B45_02755 [Candidatus Daviesbacteria bacterium RIFCSPLOWO2_01_FULL_39_12]
MQRAVLQIPLPKELKLDAEKAALDYGFSSLQEILRVFIKKLASKTVSLTFEEKGVVYLSEKNEKRYEKMMRDIESGKEKLYTAKSVDDFIKQLNA